MALNYAGIDVIRESSKIEDLMYLLVRVFIYLASSIFINHLIETFVQNAHGFPLGM